jgi:hypothetical protein
MRPRDLVQYQAIEKSPLGDSEQDPTNSPTKIWPPDFVNVAFTGKLLQKVYFYFNRNEIRPDLNEAKAYSSRF